MTKKTSTANEAWIQLLSHVFFEGSRASPRQQDTLEWLGYQSVVDMRYPLVTVEARNLGYRFAPAEAWWIGTGKNDVASIAPYSRAIAQFSDDGETFFGAYGPRLRDQLPYVVETLYRDPDSRQAVATIWRENPPRSKDIPCTVSAQWLVRTDEEGQRFVYCVDTMRSSDAWLGWPYDVFNFTMLSAYVAAYLALAWGEPVYLGKLVLQAGSQHIYRRDLEGVKACLRDPRAFSYEPLNPMDFAGNPSWIWSHLQGLADRGTEAGARRLAESPSSFLTELLERDP